MGDLYDDSAEKSVLGGLLNNDSFYYEISGLLKPDDFFRESHRIIYNAFADEMERGSRPDIHLISSHLKNKSLLEKAGGYSYLIEVADQGSTLSVGVFAKQVKEYALRRRLLSSVKNIEKNITDINFPFESLIEETENTIQNIAERSSDYKVEHISKVNDEFKEYLENVKKAARTGQVPGLATNFTNLDKLTTGFKPGQLIVLAARPGQGKTTYALNIASNVALITKKPILFYSLEMTKIELFLRLIATKTFLDSRNLQRGFIKDSDASKINTAVNEIYDSDFYIDDSPDLTSWDFRQRSRRLSKILQSEGKSLGLIIVDYLQLMQHDDLNRGKTESRQIEVSRISHSLKLIAKDLKVPVIALSQMNRSIEQRGKDMRPQLSDLRESGAIEQDADIVMFIYQKEKDKDDPMDDETEIIIAKHRAGPTGTIPMFFIKKYNAFHEVDKNENEIGPSTKEEDSL